MTRSLVLKKKITKSDKNEIDVIKNQLSKLRVVYTDNKYILSKKNEKTQEIVNQLEYENKILKESIAKSKALVEKGLQLTSNLEQYVSTPEKNIDKPVPEIIKDTPEIIEDPPVPEIIKDTPEIIEDPPVPKIIKDTPEIIEDQPIPEKIVKVKTISSEKKLKKKKIPIKKKSLPIWR